jgi:hypothetical protein
MQIKLWHGNFAYPSIPSTQKSNHGHTIIRNTCVYCTLMASLCTQTLKKRTEKNNCNALPCVSKTPNQWNSSSSHYTSTENFPRQGAPHIQLQWTGLRITKKPIPSGLFSLSLRSNIQDNQCRVKHAEDNTTMKLSESYTWHISLTYSASTTTLQWSITYKVLATRRVGMGVTVTTQFTQT